MNNQRIQSGYSYTKFKQNIVLHALTIYTIEKQLLDKYYQDTIPQFVVGDLNCNYYDTSEYNIDK